MYYVEDVFNHNTKKMFNGMNILITGGTGSFGYNFVKFILKNYPKINKIIIFSRDEFKQFQLKQKINSSKLRFFIGDVRDKERLLFALRGVNICIHAAALKHVEAAEYNPIECIKTNILGAQNVVEACIYNKVKKVIALSTDKASAPINLYGATKLCSDKIFTSSNRIVGDQNISFSVVRYGNVFGSRGSIVPTFIKIKQNNEIPLITDINMTRFNISLKESIEMVTWAIKNMKGGEIFIPKLKAYKIIDLKNAIFGKSYSYKVSGKRIGEKINEDLITNNESINTYDLGKYYAIVDILTVKNKYEKLLKMKKIKKVHSNFEYRSDNQEFLTVNQIKFLLKEYFSNQENLY